MPKRKLKELLGRESERPKALGRDLGGPLQSLGNALSEGLDSLANAAPDISLPDITLPELPKVGSTQRVPTEIGRIRYEGFIKDIEEKLPGGAPKLSKALQDLKLPSLPEFPGLGKTTHRSYDTLGLKPQIRSREGGKKLIYQ